MREGGKRKWGESGEIGLKWGQEEAPGTERFAFVCCKSWFLNLGVVAVHLMITRLLQPSVCSAVRRRPGRISRIWFQSWKSLRGIVCQSARGRAETSEPSTSPRRPPLEIIHRSDAKWTLCVTFHLQHPGLMMLFVRDQTNGPLVVSALSCVWTSCQLSSGWCVHIFSWCQIRMCRSSVPICWVKIYCCSPLLRKSSLAALRPEKPTPVASCQKPLWHFFVKGGLWNTFMAL